MRRDRLILLSLNVVGGAAVLASYGLGLGGAAEPEAALWGGVPDAVRPLYTASMLGAALGYFAFLPYLLFGVRGEASVGGKLGYGAFHAVFLAILIPSALWMPLTLRFAALPSVPLWWAIRGVLALVALGSVALTASLLALRPRGPRWAHALAVAGSLLFAWQTAVLDAVVWPVLYRS